MENEDRGGGCGISKTRDTARGGVYFYGVRWYNIDKLKGFLWLNIS